GRKVRGPAPLRPRGRAIRKTKTLWGPQRVPCRFLMEPAHRIGLGVHARRDPGVAEFNLSWVVAATAQNRNFLLCSKAELSTLLRQGSDCHKRNIPACAATPRMGRELYEAAVRDASVQLVPSLYA